MNHNELSKKKHGLSLITNFFFLSFRSFFFTSPMPLAGKSNEEREMNKLKSQQAFFLRLSFVLLNVLEGKGVSE